MTRHVLRACVLAVVLTLIFTPAPSVAATAAGPAVHPAAAAAAGPARLAIAAWTDAAWSWLGRLLPAAAPSRTPAPASRRDAAGQSHRGSWIHPTCSMIDPWGRCG